MGETGLLPGWWPRMIACANRMGLTREPDVKEGEPPGPVAPPLWPLVVALPSLTGGLWAWWAVQGGLLGVILGVLPGVSLLSSSLSNVFSGGDARISQFMTMGAFLGMLLSFPMVLASGLEAGVVLLILSSASFVASGYLAVGEVPVPAGVPKPRMGVRLSTRSAADEVAMFSIVLTTRPLVVGPRAARVGREIDEALEVFGENGWLDDPESYHRKPPPVEGFGHRRQRHKGWDLEHLSFESGYEPWPDEPGRERWLSQAPNRTAHALVLRHPGGPRPWLVCIHGLRDGSPQKSPDLFQPEYLHRELGLNLLFPFLPLHGPRKAGLLSGERLLSGEMVELVHTGAQAVWDIRRLLGWLRLPDQGALAVGVLGHSLGGFAAALLCGLVQGEEGVDCVIAANPSVDPSLMFWRDGLSMATRYLKTAGVTQKKTDLLLRAVSPLALEPRVAKERRAILASVADRIIPAGEPESLWRHWDRPRVLWHQGNHFGLLRSAEGKAAVEDVLRDSDIVRRRT